MTEGAVFSSLGERGRSMVNIHTTLMSATWMSLLHIQFDMVAQATATIPSYLFTERFSLHLEGVVDVPS